MGDASPDIYAGSRKELRETVKWYVAALTGLGAILAGGISFAVIPDLSGGYLLLGALLGIAALVAVLIGLWRVQALLFSSAFGVSKLTDTRIATDLAPHLKELLPGDVADMAALEKMLEDEEKQSPPNLAEIKRLEDLRTKVVGFAAFQDLEYRMRRTNRCLLTLFCVTCALLAVLTYLHGQAKIAAAGGTGSAIDFMPQGGWSAYAEGLEDACPLPSSGIFPAIGKPNQPVEGWWMITLNGPVCRGVTIAVPEAVVRRP
ncbi:hypothetical protein JJJ17_05290 [Paracoccus caeni]|uniref:Uncharacterized protein n=1 Tax=Paracoccus caeni TaxID=657651 RepID=A0A934SE78_9RHOB|nr:hypothetical protein [Paracoccus caeni]MBK4215336.1 hypothetical protein [Paracoccus caeni]